MALQKQVHSIPIGGGMDTKTPSTLVDEGSLTNIINGRFTQGASGGKLQSRNGFTALPGTVIGSGSLANPQSLAVINNELDCIAGNDLYAYSPSQLGWVNRGAVGTPIPSRTPIVRNNYDQSAPDSATLSGVTVFAWQDARGGVWFKVTDQAAGTVFQAEAQLDAIGSNPKVISLRAGYIEICYSTTAGNINYAQIATANPTAAPSPVTFISAGAAASTPFDMLLLSSGSVGIVFINSSSNVTANLLNSATLATTHTNVVGSVLTTLTTVACCQAGNGNLVVAGQVGGIGNQQMYVWFLSPSTAATVTNYNHLTEAGPIFALAPSQSTTTTVIAYAQVNPTSVATRYITQVLWDQVAGFGGTAVAIRGCALVGAPFIQGGGIYLLVSFVSTVQQTYFLLLMDPAGSALATIVGRYVSLNAGTYPPVQRLTHITSGQMLVTVQAELESQGGQAVIVTGLDLLTLNFSLAPLKSIQIGQDLTLSGGLPQLYDSENITENGFNTYPEELTVTLLTSMIGLTNFVDGLVFTAPTYAVTQKQSFVVTFPVNQDGSGFDGVLINPNGSALGSGPFTPTQYVTIGTSDAFWFSPGVPPPNLGAMTLHDIGISPLTPASLIATSFADSVNAASIGFTAVASGNQVTVTANSAGAQPRPQTFSQFNCCAALQGASPTTYCESYINCVPGNLIQPGQYFAVYAQVNGGYVPGLCYVWFQVSYDGGTTYVGTDPAPALYLGGIPIQIYSTDTEAGVATKLAAQFTTSQGVGAPTSTSNGPQVVLASYINAAVFAPAININVGSGLGTAGPGVATNQWDSYEWTAIFESQDAQGQLGRSAAAVPVQLQFPAYGTANFQVDIQAQPLYLTSRPSVDIAIYRTLTLGSLFYRCSSETALIYNNGNDTYQGFQDSTPDATLQSNELMYTQPLLPNSVIENNCPPAFTQAATFAGQDQLWINDCEDPQLWWYSKAFTSGVQVEWSNLQTWRFDPVGGPTVAAMTMDSNLIVFGTKGIWAVNGLGPDPTGAGSQFTVQLISSGVGLRDPNSLVLTPNGIMFMSAKGIQLLDRNLQVARRPNGTYWGAPVEEFNALTVVSAQIITNTTEVRFLFESASSSLIYDYQFDQWAAWQQIGADSIVFDGSYYFVTTSGAVLQETSGLYEDNGQTFPFQWNSPWFKPSALQGFARLWKIFLQGYFPAGVGLQIQIAYDYNPAIVDTFTWTPATDQTQLRIDPSRGPCEAFQIIVTDTGSLSSSAKYFVNMVDIEVGVKKGGFKKLGPQNQI